MPTDLRPGWRLPKSGLAYGYTRGCRRGQAWCSVFSSSRLAYDDRSGMIRGENLATASPAIAIPSRFGCSDRGEFLRSLRRVGDARLRHNARFKTTGQIRRQESGIPLWVPRQSGVLLQSIASTSRRSHFLGLAEVFSSRFARSKSCLTPTQVRVVATNWFWTSHLLSLCCKCLAHNV
jgi:hypothetical protein